MKEIGGYLELENFMGCEYYKNSIALNTARNALAYLAKARNMQKIYIPYFLCDSVSGVCDREGIAYEYYHIDENFKPLFDGKIEGGAWLYVVNFYGQLSKEDIIEYKKKFGQIILDNVQAFFDAPIEGIDTIYSCRKFFGVPDGAYLISDCGFFDIDTDSSKERMKHLLGRYEGKTASDYYADFKANDHSFVELPVRYMSRLTHNILGAIDYVSIAEKRSENWRTLHDKLGGFNKLKLTVPCGPYMYPFYWFDGMKIRKALAEKKIYVPTLWPNVMNFDSCELEKDYAQNILPLPCDQRYGTDDMARIIGEITRLTNDFYGG